MAIRPLAINLDTHLDLENREQIEAGARTEFEARVQDNLKYHTGTFIGDQINKAFREDDELLSPQEANSLYGIDGVLQFEEPVAKRVAENKAFKIRQNQDIKQFLAKESQTEGFLEKVGNLGIAFATLATDPVNYIPVGKAVQLYKIGRVIPSAMKVLRNPIARAAFDGAAGNLITQPFIKANHEELGEEYTLADGVIDVTMGGVIGGVFGAVGTGFRASGIARRKLARDAMKQLAEDVGAMQKAHVDFVEPETIGVLNSYVETMNAAGKEANPDVMKAYIKLSDTYNSEKRFNSTLFLNDTLQRVDREHVSPEFKQTIIELSRGAEIIPTDRVIDLDNVFTTTRPLSKELTAIRNSLGNFEGTMTVQDLAKVLKQDVDGLKVNLQTYLNKSEIRTNSKLKAKEVLNFYENYRSQRPINLDTTNHLKNLEDFKRRLNDSNVNKIEDINTYTETFDKLRKKVLDNPDNHGLRLDEWARLSPSEQQEIVDMVRFLQDANLKDGALKQALDGDVIAMREMFHKSKFKEQIDTINSNDAMNIIRSELSKSADAIEISEQNIIATEVEVTSDLHASPNYLDTQIQEFKSTLTEVQLEEVQKILSKEQVKDNFTDGLLAAGKCIVRALA